MRVFHNLEKTIFREPAGPAAAGSSVRITLLAEGEGQIFPVLRIRHDSEPEARTIPMVPEDPLALMGSARAADHGAPADRAGSTEAPAPSAAPASSPEPSAEPMNSADLQAFTAHFTAEKKGLYWYWFELPGAFLAGSGSHDPGDPGDIVAVGSPDGDGMEGAVSCGLFISRDPETGQAVPGEGVQAWQLTVYEPAAQDPDWIHGGVFYHIFVDRFAASGDPVFMDGKITRTDWGGMPEFRPNENGEILNNDFFGGNLAGIREKLPYLEELGVTCLYLSPIFEAYSSHKYDTSDYLRIDPMFGDEEDFRQLCAEAKARGIRIICDGVFSHTGADSRYFDLFDRWGNGACHHPDSPYRDWYYFEADGYQSWWGFRTLPRLNKDNPSYQRFISGEDGVVRHWLRAGASGWRLDVVDELPADFLAKLTAAAKAEKPDALILGEVWEDASNKIAYDERKNYFEGGKLDSVMNYPLREAIIDFVRKGNAEALARTMRIIIENYPKHVVDSLMNILGTHDTNRIITALAGDILDPEAPREVKAARHMSQRQWAEGIRRLKIASAIQMTLPGVPCVYYGDEAGMEGYNDPFNRKCYPWGKENPQLQSWYRRVIEIRRQHSVYAEGTYRLLAACDGLYAFERAEAGARQPAHPAEADRRAPGTGGRADRDLPMVTAANCGDGVRTLSLMGAWKDLLSGASFIDDVLLFPDQVMILEPLRG